MVTLFLLAVFVALVIGVMAAATSKGRYQEMSEEEFQAEAERASLLGSAVLGVHKFLQPKRVEYILKRDKHPEAEETESGDRPPDRTPPAAPRG